MTTSETGRKIAATNKRRHGEDFYREIGRKGGKSAYRPELKGFGSRPELAAEAGRKGGLNKGKGRRRQTD